jgi:hypothetical protein
MSLLVITSKEVLAAEQASIFKSIWFWITIIEFLVIIFLVYKLFSNKKVSNFTELEVNQLKKSKGTKINMDNLMDSIHNSKGLYKELSRKCHPDRFINDPKQKIAEEIFQEISKNERNFEKLTELKLRAINELNITF